MIDHLSASAVSLYLRCGVAWAFRYIDKAPEPPRAVMIRGSALDRACNEHYRRKATGAGLEPDAFIDAAVTAHRELTEGDGMVWDVPFGQSQDMLANAAGAYYTAIATKLQPRSEQDVQRKWDVALDDFHVIGYTDLVTKAGLVVDTKCQGRMASQSDADLSLQLTTYAWLTGQRQLALAVATPAGKAQLIFTERDEAQVKRVQLLYSRVWASIQLGVAVPAEPGSWMCSRSYCSFWSRCEFGGK